jgi:hypothetical protein
MPAGSGSGGALVQISAKGSMNTYLDIKPEVTFFKQQYRRHSPFAIAEADLSFQGAVGYDRQLTCVAPRNGDAMGPTYLQIKLGALSLRSGATNAGSTSHPNYGNTMNAADTIIHWVNGVGHVIIDYIEFEIGSQVIDRLYGDYLQIWERVTGKSGKQLGEMIGYFNNEQDMRNFAAKDRTLFIPIPFYYTQSSELYLPMIALQHHEVRFRVNLRPLSSLTVAYDPAFGLAADYVIPAADISGGDLEEAYITVQWVYLDVMERTIMAQSPHEYLITQVQYQSAEAVPAGTTSKTIPVHFNHPSIEMFIVYQEDRQKTNKKWFNYGMEENDDSSSGADYVHTIYPWTTANGDAPLTDPFSSIQLTLNGHDRVPARPPVFFRTVVPYEKHSQVPDRFIYNYSFAMEPENMVRPSGTCNWSRIDNVVFYFRFYRSTPYAGEIRIYNRSNNVLKIAGKLMDKFLNSLL